MSLRELDDEIVDAELVDDGELVVVAPTPAPRLLVDHDTVLYPGQELPTATATARAACGSGRTSSTSG
ncbi:hypothetical protein ABZ946_28315 [Streptomyces sp. NPDC046324]|uniref:hypothetical protein n=1 Tax=Streptomyces sp. NPDC046324 TaxID=3154915 RepID=UPI0033F42386